jgi:hypothetical protein
MPILQRIELSNFLNSTRAKPWRPDWPHQVLEINGENAALNIPNGKGKSTMVTAILSMLTSHGKSLKDLRTRFFAPVQSGHYTHIRIQVLIPMPGANDDLVAQSGGDIGGQPMVFGMYGYSGENEKLEFYSYQGGFDDAPIAHVHNLHHTLVADDDFLGQLKTCPRMFPSNAKERTKRAWLSYVEDFFDMSSLKQQLIYQLMRGAEGGHGYFEVKQPAGMNYSAAVFYERLAPELLTDVMGDLGEEGEHGIEDTIHEKVSKVIAAKHETERKAEELRKAGNTLKELAALLDSSAKQKKAKQEYDKHRQEFSLELAVLRNVIVDHPIPGVPKIPPHTIHEIAGSMVMQDGIWFLPDRVMAEFTGESAGDINRRAQERNGLNLQQGNRAQLIDLACHSFSMLGKRGPAGSLYSRTSALALLSISTNFARDWTRDKAIEVVTQAFDWLDVNGDTNPARALKKQLEAELVKKSQERERLRGEYKNYQSEKDALITEQSQVGVQQVEYRRMASSGLFTEEELKSPAQTGDCVKQALETSQKQLEFHKDKVRDLSDIHTAWTSFVREHGDVVSPGIQAAKIEEALGCAKTIVGEIQKSLNAKRAQRKSLEFAVNEAKKQFSIVEAQLNRYLETLPATVRFTELFGSISPVGLERKILAERDGVKNRLTAVVSERNQYKPSLQALTAFRSVNGDVEPAEWLRQELSTWEALGVDIASLTAELHEMRLRRAALDQAVIVAGKVAREAAMVAGGNHISLHAAIIGMELDDLRRAKILTLFSALLHTPVYPSVNEAAEAARRLEEARIEAPVFVYRELEEFCQTGNITLDDVTSHTWLVGIRTRQVDCLLDPTLVEREKELADEQIRSLTQRIQDKELERNLHSPENAVAAQARQAAEAFKNGYEAKNATLVAEKESLEKKLPELEARASSESVEIIRQTERHYSEFKGATEDDLRAIYQNRDEEWQVAVQSFESNDASIVESEQCLDEQQEVLRDATIAASKVEGLRKIQAFIDHPNDNPAFMSAADERSVLLKKERDHADQRSRFQFDLAETFIKKGPNRPKQIEDRLRHLTGEQAEIQDKLLPNLDSTIETLQGSCNDLIKQVMEIDDFIRKLTRKYRDYSVDQEELVAISKEHIERHPLGGAAIGLREGGSLNDCIKMLLDISDEIQLDETEGLKADMNNSRARYQSSKDAFAALVEKILVMSDLDLTEHVRFELQRAMDTPSIVDHLHAVATLNFEKNTAANATAAAYLEDEWENIGKWLKAFTQRLPDNLRTMKEVFSPVKDKTSGEYLSAGFEIEAKLADQEDIKAILDDVVKMVEKFESTRRAVESAAPGIRDQAVRGVRAEIRNTFYQKVILNPRVRAYMPSISKHPLPLEKNMVSTGQGVAMTLLWVVKMADYVTERELRRVTTRRVQQKHLHPTQFAIMDGAFSSLSNKGLIQDALDCIKRTRGRFQLIITGHDENYQNNFEYFPTLIEAREINGQFMYADSKTKRILQPDEVGSHYGAIEVMNLRVKPLQDAAEAA